MEEGTVDVEAGTVDVEAGTVDVEAARLERAPWWEEAVEHAPRSTAGAIIKASKALGLTASSCRDELRIVSAPIEAGFFSLSEVTDSGDHRAYNEWHQLDHMPEQYQIPGIVIGERWVSTPACRNARVFSSAELDASQYLTLYLMSEPLRETIDRFFALGKSLARLGRFYEHRRSVLSGPFRVTVMRAAPRTLVSDGAVPFRPNLGVFVVVEHAPGPPATKGSLMKAGTETDEVRVQELLGQPGVAGVWTFRSIEAFLREGSEQNTRQVTICYLDEPPVDVSQNIGEIIRELWRADPQPEFAGPFEAITPWRWDWFDHPPGAEKS